MPTPPILDRATTPTLDRPLSKLSGKTPAEKQNWKQCRLITTSLMINIRPIQYDYTVDYQQCLVQLAQLWLDYSRLGLPSVFFALSISRRVTTHLSWAYLWYGSCAERRVWSSRKSGSNGKRRTQILDRLRLFYLLYQPEQPRRHQV